MPSLRRSRAAGVATAAGLGVEDHAADPGEGLPEGGADSLGGRGGLSAARLGCAWFWAAAGVCAAVACNSAVEAETGGAAALVAAPLADTAAFALAASGIAAGGLVIDRLVAGIAIAAAVAAAAGVAGAAVVTTTGADTAALAFVPAPGADGNDAAGVTAGEAVAGAAAWAEPGAGEAAS